MSPGAHDPGGRVRLTVGHGVVGRAVFSECYCFRHELWRELTDDMPLAPKSGYALWIGMNPSTADADADDPTVRREWNRTVALGYGKYLKMNVSDFRMTDQRRICRMGISPVSRDNEDRIVSRAVTAAIVIMAHGILPHCIREHGERLTKRLRLLRVPMWCLGYTKDGMPRHPLYMRNDATLLEY